MRPLIPAALLLSGLLAAGSLFGRPSPNRAPQRPAAARTPTPNSDLESLCPAHTLPDGQVCSPVPSGPAGLPRLAAERNAHRERSGHWRVYDQIPRLPGRPTKYEVYELPIARGDEALAVSGYDLDLPDAAQRRGPHLSAVGHGGVDIAAPRGTQVHAVQLEHQVADARVLYVGPLFGNTVVTHHVVREGGQQRDYLVLFGHLERPAHGLGRGQMLSKGAAVGLVGDSGSAGVVHLHLEIRRVRTGVDPDKLSAAEYAHNARTVACDPRNVLPILP